jgi:hypothetical protein
VSHQTYIMVFTSLVSYSPFWFVLLFRVILCASYHYLTVWPNVISHLQVVYCLVHSSENLKLNDSHLCAFIVQW